MPNTGSGTMTPVSGGVPGAWTDVQPFPYTLLSIYRYAKIMGITPLHFAGAATPGINPAVMPMEGCARIWAKYDWQLHDQVSKMQLVEAIYQAEYEIATVLGYWPAPVWTAEERQVYPAPFAREYSGVGVDIAGKPKSLRTNFGRVISGGRRGVTLIQTATVAGGSLVYTDDDGDGYFETATVTVPTVLTDAKTIKLYFTGHNGELEWEVRPVRSKRISGGNIVFILDAWELIQPDLYEVFPTSDGFEAIDVSDVSNYEIAVDVYYEYNNTILASSQFIWENDLIGVCATCGGTGCEDCAPTTQDGCLTIRSYDAGIVTPFPAEYSNGSWLATTWTECREPENVKLWYYSGLVANDFTQNRSYDPLSLEFAKAIAWLTTARLDRPLCGCGNIEMLSKELQTDVASRETGSSYYVTPDAMFSPFGTKIGEIKAWRVIGRLAKRRLGVALI